MATSDGGSSRTPSSWTIWFRKCSSPLGKAWKSFEENPRSAPGSSALPGTKWKTITGNVCGRLRFLSEEEGPVPEPVDPHNIQEAIEQQQAAKKTQEVLASLPEAYSMVLRWRYWEKRGLSEIAQETGRTEKAIERLLARAREQFKRKWNER